MSAGGFAARAQALSAAIAADELDCLLVSAPANVRYLTDFSGSSALALILSPELARMNSAQHLFLSDFRYELQAAEQVPDFYAQHFISSAAGPRDLFEELADQLERLEAAGADYGRIGFEADHLTVARGAHLEKLLPNAWEASAGEGHVRQLREVKDEEEVRRIAQATALADEALRACLEGGLVGRTERDIVLDLEDRMRRLGAEGASFPSIVASGEHGALPHAQARAVQVRAGTLVTIDWGARVDCYCSDCTRTFAAGAPSAHAREIYEVVLAAQQAALDALRPGMHGSDVDALARAVIEQAGHGDRFGHGLGHGVGLEVHEPPRLSPKRRQQHPDDQDAGEEPLLRSGSVVTVEPGIYLPGDLGVRIEELVVLGPERNRMLTSLSRQLTEV